MFHVDLNMFCNSRMSAEDKGFANDENLPLHGAVDIPLKVDPSPRIALGNLQVTTCLIQEI